jgi:hypothetical protein
LRHVWSPLQITPESLAWRRSTVICTASAIAEQRPPSWGKPPHWKAVGPLVRFSVRVAGDISGKMDDVSLDELLVTIKQEWAKLGPLIDLELVQVPEKD